LKYGLKRNAFFSRFHDEEITAANIVIANDKDHRRQRRALSQPFTKTALTNLEPLSLIME